MKKKIIVVFSLIIVLVGFLYFINKDTFKIDGFSYTTNYNIHVIVSSWNKYENTDENMLIKNPIFGNEVVGETVLGMPIFGANSLDEITYDATYHLPGIEEGVTLPQGSLVDLSTDEIKITLPGFPKEVITYSLDEAGLIELNTNLYLFPIDGEIAGKYEVEKNSVLYVQYNKETDKTYLTVYDGESVNAATYMVNGQFVEIILDNEASVVIDSINSDITISDVGATNNKTNKDENNKSSNYNEPSIELEVSANGNNISTTVDYYIQDEYPNGAKIQLLNTKTGKIETKYSNDDETITFDNLEYDTTYMVQASVEYSQGTLKTKWKPQKTGSFDNVNVITTYNEITKNNVNFTVALIQNEDAGYIVSGEWAVVPEKIKGVDLSNEEYLYIVENFPAVVKTGTFTPEQIAKLKSGKPVELNVDGLNPYWEYSIHYTFYTDDKNAYDEKNSNFVTSYQDPIIDVNFPNVGLVGLNEDVQIEFKIFNPQGLPVEYITINDKQYDSSSFTITPSVSDPNIYEGVITIPANDIEGGKHDLTFNSINFTNIENRPTEVIVDVTQQFNKMKIKPEITNFEISQDYVNQGETYNLVITFNNPDEAEIVSATFIDPLGNTVTYDIATANQTTINGVTTATIPIIAGNDWDSTQSYTLTSVVVDTGTDLIPNEVIAIPGLLVDDNDSLIIYKNSPTNFNLSTTVTGANLDVCGTFDDIDNTMNGGSTTVDVKGPTTTNNNVNTITTINLIYDATCNGYKGSINNLLPGTTYELTWKVNFNILDPAVGSEIVTTTLPMQTITTNNINTAEVDIPTVNINKVTANAEDKITIQYQINDPDNARTSDFSIYIYNEDNLMAPPVIIPVDTSYAYDGSVKTQEITGLESGVNYEVQIKGNYQLPGNQRTFVVESNVSGVTTLKQLPTIETFNLESVDYTSATIQYKINDEDRVIVPGSLQLQTYYDSTNTLATSTKLLENYGVNQTAVIANLTEGKTYYLKVVAKVDLGNGVQNVELTLPTPITFTTWTQAVIGEINVSQIDQTTMALNDVVVYDPSNARIGDFKIQAYEVNGLNLTPAGNPIEITDYSGAPIDYIYTGLEPDKTYVFKLEGKYTIDSTLPPITDAIATSDYVETLKIAPTATIGTPIQNPNGTISVPVSVNDPQNSRIVNGVPMTFRLYATEEGQTLSLNDPSLTIRNYNGGQEMYTFNGALLDYDTTYTFTLVGTYDLNKGTHVNEQFGSTTPIKTIKEQPTGSISTTPNGGTEILVEAYVEDPNNARNGNFRIEVYETNDQTNPVETLDITRYDGTVNSYVISGLSPDVEYEVRLVGSYDLGLGMQINHVFDSEQLTTLKSKPTVELSVTSPSPTTLQITTKVNDPQNARTNEFVVVVTDESNSNNTWTQTITTYNAEQTFTFDNLISDHTYNIKVIGDYDDGTGLHNDYTFANLSKETSKHAPTATITLNPIGTGTVQAQVKVNDVDNSHGNNTFKVNVYQGSTLVQSKNITKYDNTNETFIFTGLTPNVNYTFKVEGIYDLNYGPTPNTVLTTGSATTWKRTPTASISVTYVGESKLNVQTTVNDPDGARTGNFQVQVYQGNTLVASQNITNYTNETQNFTFTGLSENTSYTVKIVGSYNSGGESASNTTITSTSITTRFNNRSPEVTFSNQGTTTNAKSSISMNVYDPDDALSNCTTTVENTNGQIEQWTEIDYSTTFTSNSVFNVPGSTVTWKESCEVNLSDGNTHTIVDVAELSYYVPTNGSTLISPTVQFKNVNNIEGAAVKFDARTYNPDNVPMSNVTIKLYEEDSWVSYWDWSTDGNWHNSSSYLVVSPGTKYELSAQCTFNPGTGNVTTNCGSYTFFGTAASPSSMYLTNQEINDSYYKREE